MTPLAEIGVMGAEMGVDGLELDAEAASSFLRAVPFATEAGFLPPQAADVCPAGRGFIPLPNEGNICSDCVSSLRNGAAGLELSSFPPALRLPPAFSESGAEAESTPEPEGGGTTEGGGCSVSSSSTTSSTVGLWLSACLDLSRSANEVASEFEAMAAPFDEDSIDILGFLLTQSRGLEVCLGVIEKVEGSRRTRSFREDASRRLIHRAQWIASTN